MLRNKLLIAITTLFLLVACGEKSEKQPLQKAEPVESLYNQAMKDIETTNYSKAIVGFEDISRLYPYSEWALRSEVMAAYSAYRSGKYEDALSNIDRFVKQYPNNSNTPYAFYLRAMCYYDQITDVGRDQKITMQTQQALNELIKRFPDSDYARDAKIKLDLVIDHLAGKEMKIGRYYYNKQEYLAGINRFRGVVEKYQTTTHTPEALHRLVEGYMKLGVVEQAKKYGAVLGYNYPGSDWYKDSYAIINGKPLPNNNKKTNIINQMNPF
jgi:outer membrane protein assembly factor BamD